MDFLKLIVNIFQVVILLCIVGLATSLPGYGYGGHYAGYGLGYGYGSGYGDGYGYGRRSAEAAPAPDADPFWKTLSISHDFNLNYAGLFG